MRQPTPYARLYAWWRESLANPNMPRHDGDAQCGYYKMRHVSKGPWVPVRIYLAREIEPDTGELACDEVLAIEIEGLDGGDPRTVWTYLTPITREAYAQLVDYRLRDNRMLDSRQKIDLSDTPTGPQGVF